MLAKKIEGSKQLCEIYKVFEDEKRVNEFLALFNQLDLSCDGILREQDAEQVYSKQV